MSESKAAQELRNAIAQWPESVRDKLVPPMEVVIAELEACYLKLHVLEETLAGLERQRMAYGRLQRGVLKGNG